MTRGGAGKTGALTPPLLIPVTITPREPKFRNKIYSDLKQNSRERYEKVASARSSGLRGQGPDLLLAPWHPPFVAKGLQEPGTEPGARANPPHTRNMLRKGQGLKQCFECSLK